MDGNSIRGKMLCLFERVSLSEPSTCIRADSWLATIMLNTSNYIHTHTNTVTTDSHV